MPLAVLALMGSTAVNEAHTFAVNHLLSFLSKGQELGRRFLTVDPEFE
jgi:hypothetical protein